MLFLFSPPELLLDDSANADDPSLSLRPPPSFRASLLPSSNPAREAFVELCDDNYVQKMTFDSYLYKTVVPGNPLDDVKLLVRTVGSLGRANALRSAGGVDVSFGSKSNQERVAA